MSIVQTLIGAIAPSGSYTPPTTYELTAAANNVDEGASLTFTANTTLVPNGTTLYWACTNTWGGGSLRFVPGLLGEFIINSNTGSFSITISADDTTAGGEQRYSVFLYSTGYPDGYGGGGGILTEGRVENILVNDTSLTPVAPFSLDFPAGNPYVLVSDIGFDWSLGTVYTIEFWSKQTNASTGGIRTVMSQGAASSKIDVGYANGHLLWNNSEQIFAEPTPGVWTHVAFVRESGSGNITLYYNGVNVATFNAGPALTDAASEVRIGRRGAENIQYFYGKLAMIRVSSTAKYLTNFNPIATYGVEADTKLMLGSDTPLVDASVSAHTITNIGAVVSMDFPTTYTITPEANSVNEGASLEFTVGGTGITNGNYYWTVTNSGDFGTASGSFSITSNTGSFSVTPTEDVTTEGAETFTVSVRSVSITGTVLATTESITITDTSLAPVAPFSLQFVQPQGDYLSIPAGEDWLLVTNWTIEFWLKANSTADGSSNMGGGIWGLLNQSGWGAVNQINIALSDAKLVVGGKNDGGDVRFTEPTPGMWTHVAIVNQVGTPKVYYNGVEQSVVSGTVDSLYYFSNLSDLYIGRLSPQYNAGYNSPFDGKMAMVRISDSAKYLTAFTATTTYGVDANTRLFLSSDTPLVDSMSLTVTNVGVTQSTDFPQSFIGHLNAYSGGNLGSTYSLFGDPNITAFAAIPIGARITSNLSGFGIRLVTGNGPFFGGQQITYDNTGLPGGTVSTTSDTYNFYW